ncbi:GOLGA7 [Cordylochernes scorpioides]|uniref:Ras modification protein ERF4 n=1 Tax=Cordylochernes scorpioides TaxID=51811 RepID=A0ABY6JV36_9ARAC|nr:GOLGA7 [Cordylochernes scorpioides]
MVELSELSYYRYCRITNHAIQNDPIQGCRKVFIQRDYSEGTNVKFQLKFPPELEGLVEKQCFEDTITTMNNIYAEAEKVSGRTYCEGCFACITAYLIYLCMETHYEKCLKRLSAYLDEQNETIWLPRGLYITDPLQRGLRVVEISILNEPASRS